MINKDSACCFTGHRYIKTAFANSIPQILELTISRLINKGITDYITGGALGFDTLAAQTVLNLKEQGCDIRLILALPCKTQSENWNKKDKLTYAEIMSKADEIIFIEEEYTPECMMRRNKFMVDNSSCCVFYLTRNNSGTYKTVSYAMENNLELYNILRLFVNSWGQKN